MNRATRITLLALAALVVLFAWTWLTLPGRPSDSVKPPASLLAHGLETVGNPNAFLRGPFQGDLQTLKQRVLVAFGSTAAVVILVGLAFGAGPWSRGSAGAVK